MTRIRSLTFSDGVSVTAPTDLAVGGSGSGEINLIENPNGSSALDNDSTNDVGDWVDSGTGTTSAITSTAADIPLYPIKETAIKITNDGSSTGYTRYRFTLPPSLISRKLKISWEQVVSTSTAYVSGDFKIEMYSNASSDYSGAYTAISLSTDVSSVSSIPASTGKFQTTFDTTTATYLELRITRVAGSASSYISLNEIVVGPGINPQGAVIGPTETCTFTGSFTNTTYTAKRTRKGEWAEYQVLMTLTGTPGAATLTLTLPTGDTIDTSLLVDSSMFAPGSVVQLLDTGTAGYVGVVRVESSTTIGIYYMDDAAAAVTRTAVTQAAPYTFANTDKIDITFKVPLTRYAGSGTVNVSNNDVEYAYNTGTWDATDTTSFGYGPAGKIMGGALTALRTKRVRFQTPISNTDRLELEFSLGGSIWFPAYGFNDGAGNAFLASYDSTGSGSASAGAFLLPVSGSSTDVDVQFFRYANLANDDAPTTAWQATWYWRVKKSNGGQAVGFGNVTQGSAGLVKSAGQLLGTNTNDTAATGYVGELQQVTLASGSANSLSTNVAENLTGSTLVLTAGHWRLSGMVAFVSGSATSTTQLDVSLSTTTGTLSGSAVYNSSGEIWIQRNGTTVGTSSEWPIAIPPFDIQISTTKTLYLVVRATFTVSTLTAYGWMQAVRVR
jgi:hypothetical protein